MTTIADIRKQYPQYDDLSDDELAKGLHAKYYSDLPYDDFASRIGLLKASGPTSRPVDPNRGKSAL